MNEMINTRIRYNLTENDKDFFRAKKTNKTKLVSNRGKHTVEPSENQNGSKVKPVMKPPKSKPAFTGWIIAILIASILISGFGGLFLGMELAKEKYLVIRHDQESLIRSEAIADYRAKIEAEEAEAAALKMESIQDEATRRKTEISLFAKLFEGVRDWAFDSNDLITYGVCVWNRSQSPLFPNTIDEVIHQDRQWISFSDDNKIVADYNKVAEKLVDMLYNSDVALCSTKYCWIEIRDGHLYLKDSYNPYPGMTWWRYQGEV